MRTTPFVLAAAAAAVLVASLLLRGGGVPADSGVPSAPRSASSRAAPLTARLKGQVEGTTGAGVETRYEDADLPTTLGALRFQPPNVPPGAVARLRALVRGDPGLLDHLVRVGLGWADYGHGPLPADYPYDARCAARWAALALPREATPVVAALLEEVGDDARRRRALLYLLASFRGDAEAAVPTLLALLDEKDLPVATGEHAIFVLGSIGRAAAAAAPALLTYARDPAHPLRDAAVQYLYAVAGMTSDVEAYYRGLLEGRGHADREAAFDVVLHQMGEDAEPLRPLFVRLLEDEQHDICMWAALALAQIGVGSPEVVERLGRLAEEGDLDIEAAALGALRTAGKRGQEELLTIAKRAEYLETAVNALFHLGHTGYPVRDHPQLLLGLLRDAESGVRGNVVYLIAHLEPKPRASDFASFLQAQVRDTDSALRHGALSIAANLEEDGDRSGLDLLLEALEDGALRATAAPLLGARQADAERILPALEPHLDERAVMDALQSLALGNERARARIRYLVEHGASERIRAFAVSASELLDEVDVAGPDER